MVYLLPLKMARSPVFWDQTAQVKTTCLRTLYGLLKADQGTAKIDGIDAIAQPLAARAQLGIFPDKFGLYERLTAREQNRLFCQPTRFTRSREKTGNR